MKEKQRCIGLSYAYTRSQGQRVTYPSAPISLKTYLDLCGMTATQDSRSLGEQLKELSATIASELQSIANDGHAERLFIEDICDGINKIVKEPQPILGYNISESDKIQVTDALAKLSASILTKDQQSATQIQPRQ